MVKFLVWERFKKIMVKFLLWVSFTFPRQLLVENKEGGGI